MLQVNKLTFQSLLRPSFLLIFSALILSTLSEQLLQSQLELVIRSREGLSNSIWLWGLLAIAISVFFPLLISLLCAYHLVSPRPHLKSFFSENFELSFIETLRAWGKTLLWSFVFLIPGVIKYINYILTPFVVLFSKRYKNGEVDALEYSTKISKNFWWSIKIWLGVFYVLLPIVFYVLFESYRSFAQNPVGATLVVLLESVVELVFHFIILRLFIHYLNEVENGAHV